LFAQSALVELAGLLQQQIPRRVVLEQQAELLISIQRFLRMVAALVDLAQTQLPAPQAAVAVVVVVLVEMEVPVRSMVENHLMMCLVGIAALARQVLISRTTLVLVVVGQTQLVQVLPAAQSMVVAQVVMAVEMLKSAAHHFLVVVVAVGVVLLVFQTPERVAHLAHTP
jgi:hypothetical protein